jgi:UDP-N-acetyl-D-mannosaminuronic acid dehydrogenase
MIVSVIGACGHVGLPFSLVVAEASHTVYGIDVNETLVDSLNAGTVPYIEHGAGELLLKNLASKNISFTINSSLIKESDVVAVMLGTPVDEENNPRLDGLFDFVDNTLIPFMKKGTLVILRSTVSPGTTEVIRDRIEAKTSWNEGSDFYLVFCPERVLQTRGIEETANLPQLIGAFTYDSFNKAMDFFITFVKKACIFLTPKEAEIAKLMTNMWRRVNGAFANEMYMIGDQHSIDIHKVINAANLGYDRMNVMLPGFMSGPCLYKDGEFLVGNTPYNEIIKTSFEINEGFVGYVFNKAKMIVPDAKTCGILGTGFKANCDDERLSLGHKMKKIARMSGMEVKLHDPFHTYQSLEEVLQCDIVILMVPHDQYKTIDFDDIHNTKLFVDVWKSTILGRNTINGFTFPSSDR